ncbi:protein O-mannosyl-transferase family [Thermospira aquatica]|uniref:DUF2723 domain-containing protein n=1 Tax=Thermospira aquatica TaxID=2828656 RepID=A0AAX3BEY5_9SPIR|nr:DUF2723 domain-containing protein [Thermospira aquatica]URA10917.1 DUF2723 domain-containing protein [Thermospira aquatica]
METRKTTSLSTKKDLFARLYPDGYRPYRFRWFDYVLALLVFLTAFTGYIKTLTPSIGAGDSGELTTTLYNMGASHAPGFPLYGILGKLFTYLAVGDIGYRVNIYTATTAAGAVLFLFLTLLKLLGLNRTREDIASQKPKAILSVHIPALAASLAFAFASDHWQQAVGGEVYSLNVFLVSMMIFVMVWWYEELIANHNRQEMDFAYRKSLLLAYVMGLSLTDHQLPLWYIVAFFVVMFPLTFFALFANKVKDTEHFSASETFDIWWIVIAAPFLALFVMQFSGRLGLLVLLFGMLAGYSFFALLLSHLKEEYRKDFMIRLPHVLTMGGLAILSVAIFLNKAYLARLIYPQDVGWILFSIFLVPTYLMVYTLVVKLLHLKSNWVDRVFEIMGFGSLLFIFAMTIYLYMMVRANALADLPDPKPLSWGDTRSLEVLFNQMLRKQYGGRAASGGINYFWGQLAWVGKFIVDQYGIINVLIGIGGFVVMLFREKIWATYLLWAMTLLAVSLIKFVNPEVDAWTQSFQVVMHIQNFWVYAIFLAYGYQALIDAASGSWSLKSVNEDA